MDIFQEHTEIGWLSIGPAIYRIIEKWDAIRQFIGDLEKDEKTAPKRINYKRVEAMIGGVEKDVTKVLLEFLKNTVPHLKISLLSSRRALQPYTWVMTVYT